MKLIRLLVIGLLTSTKIFGAFDPRTTRDIIIDIDITVTTCVCPLENDFQGTFSKLENISGILEGLSCNATLITQLQVGTTGYVITSSGTYKLNENITFNPVGTAAAITINADNVVLDLACFIINQGNATANVDGISISANHENIIIVNGQMSNFSRDGIRIASGCSNLSFADTTFDTCLVGIAGIGTGIDPIQIMRLVGLDFLSNTTGVSFTSVSRAFMSDCSYSGNDRAGIEFINSYSNSIDTCLINDINAVDGSVFGITVTGGGDNRIENCTIDGLSTNDTSSLEVAAGIAIGSNENSDIIANSIISNITTTSSALPFGIEMLFDLSDINLTASIAFAPGITVQPNSALWSPNGRYVAVGSTNTNSVAVFAVYEFTGSALVNIATVNQGASSPATNPLQMSWSPDGLYLAVNDGSRLNVYRFSDSQLILVANVTFPGAIAFTGVSWSPNGRYIASSGTISGQSIIYQFTGTTLVQAVAVPIPANGASLSWSPDSLYLVRAASTGNSIYRFSNPTAIEVATFSGSTSVSWSPNGQNIATALNSSDTFQIIKFTGTTTQVLASFTDAGTTISSAQWSPDGNYLVVSSQTGATGFIRIYNFTGDSLLQLKSQSTTVDAASSLKKITWSPEGQAIAAITNNAARVYTAFTFPSNTVVMNNEVFGVTGPALASGQPGVSSGRGISVSSASNLILQNTIFSSNLNYVFVNNVFQQYITNTRSVEPSILSNLSFPPL